MLIAAGLAAFAALLFLFAEGALGPIGPFVKMIPAAALGVMVLQAASRAGAKLAAIGLLVSALADAAIEFSFLGGLVTFLLAHIFYIAAFTVVEPRLRLARLAPLAVWAGLVLPALSSGAGALRVPVLIYGAVIFAMIWRAAATVSSASLRDPAITGLLGAFLFGVSDTLLGYNRFVAPLPASDILILGTYWTAQALIAASFLRGR
jgi:alkenylglycerophosphocholine hydrolase